MLRADTPPHYKARIFLPLILVVVAIGKLTLFISVYAADPSRILSPDSASYVDTARALLKTGRFEVSPDKPGVPQTRRTPGYPFFIASIFFFFGEKYSPLIVAQIILSLGTIFITYHIAAHLWGSGIGCLSAFLLSLDLVSFVSSQKILTETLFTFVLSAALVTGIHTLKYSQKQAFRGFLLGFLFAVTALIRPISYYVIIPVSIVYTVLCKRCFEGRWKRIFLMLFVLLLPWFGLIGGWQLRNYAVAGSPQFSTIQGVNLLFYRGAGIIAQRDGVSFKEAQQRLGYGHYTALHPESAGLSRGELSQRWKWEGIRLIFQYPWLFTKDTVKGGMKVLFMPGEDSLLTHVADYRERTGPLKDFFTLSINAYIQKWVFGNTSHFILFVLAGGYLLVFYAGILVSLWNVIRTRTPLWGIHLFLWTIIVYFIIISSGVEGYYRFRIPVMPVLSVYAGRGIYLILAKC